MRYHALACDYDGTLADEGAVAAATHAALERLQASGRKLIIVTGRRLDDLLRVYPESRSFDAIVAENGALVHAPASRQTRLVGQPPPPSFVAALRDRGVEPLDAGEVIVATRQPHEATVLDVIRAAGLELQVIFNKGAVMVLPSGVNKATGLAAALDGLGLSRLNAVAIGDGENDHALLAHCACAVAVDNAVDSLKAEADLVTRGAAGAGVRELIEALLNDDLAALAPRLERHDVPIARTADGTIVRLPAYGGNLLVAGSSGGGKSTLVTAFMDGLAERGFQHCVVDPEGDYSDYDAAAVLGDRQRPPTLDEIMNLLASPAHNVVVNLLGVALADRPQFFAALQARLHDLRARTGRPHWIVVDECHQLLPERWQAAGAAAPQASRGLVLVTVHPDHVLPAVLRAVDTVVVTGRAPAATLAAVASAAGAQPPREPVQDLPPGEILIWRPRSGAPPLRAQSVPGRSAHKRHARKYAEGELGPDKSFFFRGPDDRLNLRAQNLILFLQIADGVDAETWLHHLDRRDYSRWIREAIKDEALAQEIAGVEGDRSNATAAERAASTRARVRAAIEARYTAAP